VSIDRSALTLKEVAHYNGGQKFFAYGYQCNQYPQLTLFRRFDRKTKQVSDTWRVCGIDQPNIDVAIQAIENQSHEQ